MFTLRIKARLAMTALPLLGVPACGSDAEEDLDAKVDSSSTNDEIEGTDKSDTQDGSDDTHEPSEATRWTGSVCPPNNPPTYANFGQAFMAQHCTRCHSKELSGFERNGATPSYDFDTLDGIKARLDTIEMMAAAGPKKTNTLMPPGGSEPTEAQRERLGAWIACLLNDAE